MGILDMSYFMQRHSVTSKQAPVESNVRSESLVLSLITRAAMLLELSSETIVFEALLLGLLRQGFCGTCEFHHVAL